MAPFGSGRYAAALTGTGAVDSLTVSHRRESPASEMEAVAGASTAGSVRPTPSSRRGRPRSTIRLADAPIGHQDVEALPSIALLAGAAAWAELAVTDPPRARSTVSWVVGPERPPSSAGTGGISAPDRTAAQTRDSAARRMPSATRQMSIRLMTC